LNGKTQDINIIELLESGIRYLDIRLGLNEKLKKLYITHGPSSCLEQDVSSLNESKSQLDSEIYQSDEGFDPLGVIDKEKESKKDEESSEEEEEHTTTAIISDYTRDYNYKKMY